MSAYISQSKYLLKKEHLDILNKTCLDPAKAFSTEKPLLLYSNFNKRSTDNPRYSSHKHVRRYLDQVLAKRFPQTESNLSYQSYLNELSQYKFCLSPPGNGIDCHRHWEALMVGTIPIILRSPLDQVFDDLPVLLVDNYACIKVPTNTDIWQLDVQTPTTRKKA